jgi:hypothetical protein
MGTAKLCIWPVCCRRAALCCDGFGVFEGWSGRRRGRRGFRNIGPCCSSTCLIRHVCVTHQNSTCGAAWLARCRDIAFALGRDVSRRGGAIRINTRRLDPVARRHLCRQFRGRCERGGLADLSGHAGALALRWALRTAAPTAAMPTPTSIPQNLIRSSRRQSEFFERGFCCTPAGVAVDSVKISRSAAHQC